MTTASRSPRILVVEARFYEEIADELYAGAEAAPRSRREWSASPYLAPSRSGGNFHGS